ncbi:MAG: N-acetylmuramoyl-L-alanine amidase [Agathobaculum sp.]|jgi:N-acetylmuramoyl-L-alanine amidase|uniref:N-acetylmuramoyl-L-alanine amidase n=1 Tax=Agathobaculum sp. TaxID=2048138 RepID=UPI003D8DB7DC
MANKIFIGVGHGGADPGARANGLVEKDVNLAVALAMRDVLVRHGVAVRMSRTTDKDDTVQQEVAECNAYQPDYAVEVHSNAGGGTGFEAYTYPGSARAVALARNIERQVMALGQTSRGVKQTSRFYWLRKTTAPAVLCEGFFLDGADHQKFRTPEQQQALGTAYARGVLQTLGIAWQQDAPAAEKRYATVDELPADLRPAIQALVDSGALRGVGGSRGLDLTYDMARMLVVSKRYTDIEAATMRPAAQPPDQ